MTHDELVDIAFKYMKKDYPIVISEMTSAAMEEPDVFACNTSESVLIECKTSRSDFLADKKKFSRRVPELGLGVYRYYFCVEGLIIPEELPDKWGLIYVTDSGIREIVDVKNRRYSWENAFERNHKTELYFLISAIRRLSGCSHCGISIKKYPKGKKAKVSIKDDNQPKGD